MWTQLPPTHFLGLTTDPNSQQLNLFLGQSRCLSFAGTILTRGWSSAIHNFYERVIGRVRNVSIRDQEGQDQRVAIDVNSLAQALAISKAQAKHLLSNQGSLEQIASFTRFTPRSDPTPSSTSEETSSANTAISGNSTSLTDSSLSTLDPVQQQQIDHIFAELAKTATQQLLQGKSLDSVEISGPHFHLVKERSNLSLHLIDQILGKGAQGTVFSTLNHEGQLNEEVIKLAHRGREAEIKHESAILNLLNPDGQAIGLQLPPKRIVYLKMRELKATGLLAPRYDGDLTAKNFASYSGQWNHLMGQLVQGLQSLHQKGWYHGDIKPKNMLYNLHLGRCDLSDLAGAQNSLGLLPLLQKVLARLMIPSQALSKIHSLHTSGYMQEGNTTATRQLIQDAINGKIAPTEASVSLFELQKARDLYALAKSMVETAIGREMKRKDFNPAFFQLELMPAIGHLISDVRQAAQLLAFLNNCLTQPIDNPTATLQRLTALFAAINS